MSRPVFQHPNQVLTEIVQQRRQRIEDLKIELAHTPARQRPQYSLKTAIEEANRVGPALILECKAASPSAGNLITDYDPARRARAYAKTATGLSVLTEPDYFQGSFQHLALIGETVNRPLLAKDFVIDPVQIELAARCGADAVLLILATLDDSEYKELARLAATVGLEVMTEVLTDEEAERARSLEAQIVDINHRNLHDLSVDLERCYRLAPILRQGSNPPLVVAASGMRSGCEIALRYRSDLAQAFLVGSSLSSVPEAEISTALATLTKGLTLSVDRFTNMAEETAASPADGTADSPVSSPVDSPVSNPADGTVASPVSSPAEPLANADSRNQNGPADPSSTPIYTPYYGQFGGQYVPQILLQPLDQLEKAFYAAQSDPVFQEQYRALLRDYLGRPTPITRILSTAGGVGAGNPGTGARIYLKREDLNHGGAHKGNQVIGQALLAKRMGKTKIIAETGAGQHGTATAMVCARLGLQCTIYMGAKDVQRQAANVYRMRLMGAEVIPVHEGSATLKNAVNQALRHWSASYQDTHYLLGTAAGPHPFPMIVREYQRVISTETRAQILQEIGQLPDEVIACVGGGSNAIGMFADFIADPTVRLTGVEPAGKGLATGEHGAVIGGGLTGVAHGARTYVMRDQEGQFLESYSISAGLDYPAVGPEHAHLAATGRAQYVSVTDAQAVAAFHRLSREEGIIPALESAHALAYAYQRAAELPADQVLVVCLSGRGDKDIDQIQHSPYAHYQDCLAGGEMAGEESIETGK